MKREALAEREELTGREEAGRNWTWIEDYYS